jgi:hypothetical protein
VQTGKGEAAGLVTALELCAAGPLSEQGTLVLVGSGPGSGAGVGCLDLRRSAEGRWGTTSQAVRRNSSRSSTLDLFARQKVTTELAVGPAGWLRRGRGLIVYGGRAFHRGELSHGVAA